MEDCERPVEGHGLCKNHRRKMQRWGDPLAKYVPPRVDVYERWLSFVEKQPDGCWMWTGRSIGRTGYGSFWLDGKTVLTHRFSYEHHVGPIPQGLHLDHLCKVRLCVRPDHLEPVTQQENNRRSSGPSAVNAAKTHCPKGHPYDEANTYRDKKGRRSCIACRKDAEVRFAAKKKALRESAK